MNHILFVFLTFICCCPSMFALAGVMLCKWLTIGAQPRFNSAKIVMLLIFTTFALLVCSVCGFISIFS